MSFAGEIAFVVGFRDCLGDAAVANLDTAHKLRENRSIGPEGSRYAFEDRDGFEDDVRLGPPARA